MLQKPAIDYSNTKTASSGHPKLNQLQATAICGNDISSSCLYVSALTIIYAGQYAWVSLLIVALVLFLFRKIYGEVVGALPLNGGAYNVLLNTTSKRMAPFAACLTILSYMATAVISAYEAMFYLHDIVNGLPLMIATVILLAIFMALSIIGIGESAKVAAIIFIIHLTSLLLLVLLCCWFLLNNGPGVFNINWHLPRTNRVMIYVEENETTKRLKIVHVCEREETNNEALLKDIEVLDRAYPDIHIEFGEVEGKFGPDIIEELSKKWKIPKNFMLIGSPGNKFPYRVSELGGVRLIM